MADLTFIGRDDVSERELFVIDAGRVVDAISAPRPASQHFACLLAWDSSAATNQDVVALARHLLSTGCVYICCWGPDCERVHDSFDTEEAAMRPNGPFAISTWHSDESLADALWYVLFNSFPDAAYSDACRATVAIAIGAPQWAEEARAAFLDPKAFSARLLGEEHA
jgi:hypothetical protein